MPGYEDLTPDQIMTLAWLSVAMVSIFVFGMLVRSIITLKISKNLKNLEIFIEKRIVEAGVKKPSFFESVKFWWVRRKDRKLQEKLYEPFK